MDLVCLSACQLCFAFFPSFNTYIPHLHRIYPLIGVFACLDLLPHILAFTCTLHWHINEILFYDMQCIPLCLYQCISTM